jgi:hypothetical protein
MVSICQRNLMREAGVVGISPSGVYRALKGAGAL